MKAGRRAQWAWLGLLGLLLAGPAQGAAQALRWQGPPDSETLIVGYRLYMGEMSGEYDRVFDLGLPHLEGAEFFGAVVEVPEGEILYGALASYDQEGHESELSEEMILRALLPGPDDVLPVERDPVPDGGLAPQAASLLAMGATTGQARLVTSPPGDPRLFAVEQTGQVRLIEGGLQRAKPFLDLDDQTAWVDGGGLMSVAFDPDYRRNGYLYVSHTDPDGFFLLTRFTVGQDAYSVDRFSAVEILEILLPYRGNPGGGLAFGAQGHLFVAIGDGGGTGDPGGLSQDGQVLQGKVLRIDVSDRPVVVSQGRARLEYGIPQDNPFVEEEQVRDEVWALGLRNPERISIDSLTGDLWIADRGERLRHEVNWESGGGGGGLNYAWNRIEGTRCYGGGGGRSCATRNFVKPAVEYAAISDSCGVSGGSVYRGVFPDWQGRYFFVDECRGELWSYDFDAHELVNWSSTFQSSDLGDVRAVALGEGGRGELYVVGSDWGVYKLGLDQPECSDGFDNDGDGRVDHPEDSGCESALSRRE
ncbi:MAG: PQQ-dependent sugar dehydrogenase, partial [Myxococcota bacterium]|nr:PQQ-dependent sugar dehydrogenase [Myxococcota bacterium]